MARGEEILQLGIIGEAAGLAVALALLVLDDAALVIEHALRHRAEQMPHAVALHEQRPLERARGHGFEIVGAVEEGRAVIIGCADLLEIFEIVARKVLATVEHEMFVEVREAGLARRLVLRADIVPGRDRDDRRLMVFVDDDGEAVGEAEHGVGNGDLADEARHGRGGRGDGGQRGRGEQGGKGQAHVSNFPDDFVVGRSLIV